MNKTFAIISLLFGIVGTGLDVVWLVQITTNFGKLVANTSPDTTNLLIKTFAVFLVMSLFFSYLGYHHLTKH